MLPERTTVPLFVAFGPWQTLIVAKPATNIHIPLSTNEAISLIARVKPDATMPRPGATKSKAKPKRKRVKKG